MSANDKAGVTVGDVVNHVTTRAKEFCPIAAEQMMSETHMNTWRSTRATYRRSQKRARSPTRF